MTKCGIIHPGSGRLLVIDWISTKRYNQYWIALWSISREKWSVSREKGNVMEGKKINKI